MELLGVTLGDTMYIVTEFMEKGNLANYLRTRGRKVITKKDQISFARWALVYTDSETGHYIC